MIKVSVVLPIYNVSKYLPKCLDSIINQTLKEIEIICVDDGSTDNSLDVLNDYAKKDNRIIVIHQENSGAGVARNIGLKKAKGEYVHFFDPDDYCEKNMLEDAYKCACVGDCDIVVFGRVIYSDELQRNVSNKPVAKYVLDLPNVFSPLDLGHKLFITFGEPPWNKIYKVSFLRDKELFFQNLPRNNDVYFVYLAFALANKISVVDDCPYIHRVCRLGSLQNTSHDETPYTMFDIFDALESQLLKYGLLERFEDALYLAQISSYITKLSFFYNTDVIMSFYKRMKESPVYQKNSKYIARLDDLLNQEKYVLYLDVCINDEPSQFLLNYICKSKIKRQNSFLSSQNVLKYPSYARLPILRKLYDFKKEKSSMDKTSKEVIVTITSSATRLHLATQTIISILYQSYSADKVVLWLPIDEFPNGEKDLPNALLDLINVGLIVEWGTKSSLENKIVPTLKKYNTSAIVVWVDDKFIYNSQWLENLILRHIKSPKDIICHTMAKCIKHNEKGFFVLNTRSVHSNVSCCFNKPYFDGYVFYPAGSLLNFCIDDIEKADVLIDEEILVWAQTVRNGFSACNDINLNAYIEKKQSIIKLNKLDYNRQTIDKFLKVILSTYPDLKQKLIFEWDCQNHLKNDNMLFHGGQLIKWYKQKTKKQLNLVNPKSFSEKVQWLKLYDSTQVKTLLSDGFLVREWVKERVGEKYLVPLIGIYENVDDIDFESLPSSFILKCNHGPNCNLVVRNNSLITLDNIKRQVQNWMTTNYGINPEAGLFYRDISRKIIIESFIDENLSKDSYSYKLWCFNGKVKYVLAASRADSSTSVISFYDKNWVKQDFFYGKAMHETNIPKPNNLDEMISVAEKLAKDLLFVQIEFNERDNGSIYFSKMLFAPESGIYSWNRDDIDKKLGRFIKLPKTAYNIDTGEWFKPTRTLMDFENLKQPLDFKNKKNTPKKNNTILFYSYMPRALIANKLINARDEISNLNQKVIAYKTSLSYRVGLLLTLPLRMLYIKINKRK